MRAEDVLKEKSKESHIPFGALLEVYRRGIGAHKSSGGRGIRNASTGKKDYSAGYAGKLPKEAWANARTNAFINKKPTVYYGADNDVRKKYHLQ